MKKIFKRHTLMQAALGIFMTLAVLALVGCEGDEGPMQTAGEKIDGAVETTGHAVKGAAETTGHAVKGAADTTGNAIKGAGEKTGDVFTGSSHKTSKSDANTVKQPKR